MINPINEMNKNQNPGNIVKRQRNRLGLTLVELAAESGVSPTLSVVLKMRNDTLCLICCVKS
jgi:hypothetical protein